MLIRAFCKISVDLDLLPSLVQSAMNKFIIYILLLVLLTATK